MIPSDGDAEFVAHQVLEIYEKPYDPKRPVVCMDEQPVQLGNAQAVAATKDPARRLRTGEHRLHGLRGPVFLAPARKRRTKVDWAEEVANLLEGRYADCEKIALVCDNLNAHTPGAFYKAACGRGI